MRYDGTFLQEHRRRDTWTCPYCGRIIEGRYNTIHLGILSHIGKHKRDKLKQVK
jgi:hypothetical protein